MTNEIFSAIIFAGDCIMEAGPTENDGVSLLVTQMSYTPNQWIDDFWEVWTNWILFETHI